jgi:hypothetical protein
VAEQRLVLVEPLVGGVPAHRHEPVQEVVVPAFHHVLGQ